MIESDHCQMWVLTFDSQPPNTTRRSALWFVDPWQAHDALTQHPHATLWGRTIETMTALSPWKQLETAQQPAKSDGPHPE